VEAILFKTIEKNKTIYIYLSLLNYQNQNSVYSFFYCLCIW